MAETVESKVKLSSTLLPVPFNERAEEVASSVLYQQSDADSHSLTGWSFYIRSPAHNALLDSEILIEYEIEVTLTDINENVTSNLVDTTEHQLNSHLIALREGWSVARAIQNLSCSINGVNLNHQPSIWLDEMNRLFVSQEESETVMSLSGGAFDTGENLMDRSVSAITPTTTLPAEGDPIHMNLGIGNFDSAAVTAANTSSYKGFNTINSLNDGFDKRTLNFWQHVIKSGVDAASITDPTLTEETATIKIYERMPIGPFFLYESRDIPTSIPYVQTLSLVASFESSFGSNPNLIFNHALDAVGIAMDFAKKPILHLRWRMAPLRLPPTLSVKCPIIREYRTEVTVPGASLDTAKSPAKTTQRFANINLEAVPSMLLIYIKRQLYTPQMGSNLHAGIENLELQFGGAAGKLNNISNGELYCMYLKNSQHHGLKKVDYQTWKHATCVVAVKPEDIGLDRGAGFDYPVQLSVQCEVWNYSTIPSFRGADSAILDDTVEPYWFCVVAYYDKSELILNEAGGGKLRMLRV